LSARRLTPKLGNHLFFAVHDCLFNIFAATLHIGGRFSIQNLRTRHAMVTWTHLSRSLTTYPPPPPKKKLPALYQGIRQLYITTVHWKVRVVKWILLIPFNVRFQVLKRGFSRLTVYSENYTDFSEEAYASIIYICTFKLNISCLITEERDLSIQNRTNSLK
jgi:hypothetical protein